MKTLKSLAVLALLGASLSAGAAPLEPAQAQQALARGAVAWDLRPAGAALLPGAVRVDAAALQRWRAQGDLAALAQAVSAAGINLASEVVVYADTAEPQITALAASLAGVSRGRVHHLAGGIEAWTAAGLPTQSQPSQRLPVPQRLVAIDAGPGHPAAPALRATHTIGIDPARAETLASGR